MINLLYQSQLPTGKHLPNSIPFGKRSAEFVNQWGNVKNDYLEEMLDYAGIGYNQYTIKDAEKNNELTYWYHIQPDWIDLSFFYENVFHYIDDNVMQKIKTQNNYKILIWFPTEGFNLSMPRFMDDILWTLGDKGIPHEKVYLVFGDMRMKENFQTYLKDRRLTSEMKVFGMNIFELNYHLETDRMYFSRGRMREINVANELVHPNDVNHTRIRSMKYVCRNANPRSHRLYLVSKLYKEGLLNDGYVSFLNRYFTPGANRDEIHMFTNDKNYDSIADDMRKFLNEKAPLILDDTAETIGISLNQRRMNVEHYANSYFSIINETVCESAPMDPLFITEKVYQPILQLHPFIVIGSRNTLSYLKDCGYKTFDTMFDESYDSKKISADRIDTAWHSIQMWCRVGQQNLHDAYVRQWDTLLHNREHFLNLNKRKTMEEFVKWIKQ